MANYRPATQQVPLGQGEQLHTHKYAIRIDNNGYPAYGGVVLVDKVMLDEAIKDTRH